MAERSHPPFNIGRACLSASGETAGSVFRTDDAITDGRSAALRRVAVDQELDLA
jgi:hypothetical protein